MRFRFTLLHSILGSLEISEPSGWIDTVLKLERHEEYHSLIEYFDGDFIFYGQTNDVNGGIDFIRQVETSYGADAELGITIEIAPDGFNFQTVFVGQLDLWNAEEMTDNKMKIPIIRNDFWAKFINRLDTPVDIQDNTNLDDTSADSFDNVNLRLTSQTILKRYHGEWSTGETLLVVASDGYIQLTPNNITLDEIETAFNLGFSWNPEVPVWWMEIDEAGEYVFNFQICLSGSNVFAPGMAPADPRDQFSVLHNLSGNFWDLYFQLNGDSPQIFTMTSVFFVGTALPSSGYEKYTFSITLNLNVGDIVRVYGQEVANIVTKLAIWGTEGSVYKNTGDTEDSTIDNVTSEEVPSFFDVRGNTIFPENNCQAFLLHDVGGQIVDRITGHTQAFYSELVGSSQTIYRQYVSDGCLWPYALAKGLQIRRYSLVEKPFFQSFKQWWDGANPIFNLGLSYETIAGHEVIRIEYKRHFYNEDVSLNIDYVRDIVRSYDDNRVFKTVKIGYKKWQSEDVLGIDDAQSKHTYASILKKGGKDITLESEFIAASLAIETTRRKTREKSADYKFDNDTFIIALNPAPTTVSPDTSPEVTDYLPELDENFDSIENLLNADTRYNSRLTPARNFMRWRDWLSGCLQAYPLTAFKFTAGEGNYDMSSDLEDVSDGCEGYQSGLSEKEDILVSSNPFHLALLYEIRIPLDWEDYLTIRNNRKKAIGISQTNENHVKFFIKELNYEIVKGEATIQAWPIELMTVEVIESGTPQLACGPVDPCEDAYLTELLEELITESGDCLVLN